MNLDEEKPFKDLDWSKVTREYSEYALEEAKICLKTGLEACGELDKKAFFIITGAIGYISVLFPFVLKSDQPLFIIPSIVMILGFLIAVFILSHSIKPQIYLSSGNEPDKTLLPVSLNKDFNHFLHWELYTQQELIKHNAKLNAKKGKHINLAIIVMQISLVVAVGIYIVSYFPS
ncbi:MAG: hypothetical protein PQ612_05890 [Rickettsiales bacterium]|nr:hypothetical protein [Pseudomonadota bacterium]MDA0966854.1 hypothetical protein [Pseudomonadota bacterium]MDG4543529.1 hypothetical protein [Rickettsiales bacterium]MDG4545677.1 hypothetical protein [Rickettsiales bacterium]MDG4547550.1 hypothetical protein [Rickettsiales bacterium]